MKQLVTILALLLLSIANAQADYISNYHPFPDAKRISVRSCKENPNGFVCPHGRVLMNRADELQVSLELFNQRFPIRFATMPLVVSNVWNADLNQDGKADVIIKLLLGGNGVGGDANYTVFALSSPNGYRLTTISSISFDPEALIFLKGKPVVLHTALILTTSSRTRREHTFWVFHPLEIRGSELVRNQAPIWIQYTFKPSHRRTNKLTALEKQAALKANPIQFFEPIK